MELGLLGVIGIAVLVGVAVLSRRIGVAAPLILVVVGIGLSFIPGVGSFNIPDEWILAGVLPPILYAAAIKTPVTDFRRNLAPIASLSVALVVVSAFVIGLLLHALLPGLGFAAALALGAVISPPDAVAATSIGRRLGLPPRLLTVLEGEGLVNDATALCSCAAPSPPPPERCPASVPPSVTSSSPSSWLFSWGTPWAC